MHRRKLLGSLGAGGLALSFGPAFSQPKSARIIVGSAAGGQTDLFARTVADALQRRTGQVFLVDNRTGAGGSIAAQNLLGSPADGSTMLLVTLGHVMTPHLQKPPPFNPLTDFAPIASLARGGTLLVVNQAVPVKDLRGFIAYAKSNPGKLNFGSAGVGSPQHLEMEYLQEVLGIEMTHVPYRGASPATLALRTGEISVLMSDLANADPIIKEGHARAVAQTGLQLVKGYESLQRVADISPGFDCSFWMGLVARNGTPETVLDKFNRLVNEVVKKELVERIATAGLEPFVETREQFGKFMAREDVLWADVIKKRNLSMN